MQAKFLFLLFVFVSLSTWANANKKVTGLYKTCLQCHQDGTSAAQTIAVNGPNIAGQWSWYLQKQIRDFKAGLRGTDSRDGAGHQMAAISQMIPDEMVGPLSDYIANLPPFEFVSSTTGNLKNGYRYYHARCGACHGSEGQGDESFMAPNIRIMPANYLKMQIEHFQQGIRGTSKDDKLGRQMGMMANAVSDKELNDIIHFLGQ